MKKTILTLAVVATMILGTFAVSAAAVEDIVGSNMDAQTFVESRFATIDDAVLAGEISEADGIELKAHIQAVADAETFGSGSQYAGEGNEDCVLGEEGNLGLFRNDNSGLENGLGNGVKRQATDGSNAGAGNARKGAAVGQGNGGRGNGGK